MMPSVTATAAWLGLRPVAKAFAATEGIRKMRGIGIPARAASRSTMVYSVGASARLTGCARWAASASRSENQYITKFVTQPEPAPEQHPLRPPKARPPMASNATSPAIRRAVRT